MMAIASTGLFSALAGAAQSDMPRWLTAAVLIAVRLSGIMLLAPIFSSPSVAPRIKAGFVFAFTLLMTPVVERLPGARLDLQAETLFGELAAGLAFGLTLAFLNEALLFTGTLLGQQFSFSLVNLLDPNSNIETPVLGQMLAWLGILVLIAAGLDRTILLALARSFIAVPPGTAEVTQQTAHSLANMASGIFLSGLQLASPVMTAAFCVELTIALIGRLSPQLPSHILSVPLKTLVSYGVLIGSLAIWPRWIESHFTYLLNAASGMMVRR